MARALAQNRSQGSPTGDGDQRAVSDKALPAMTARRRGKDLEGTMTRRYESYRVRCWRWTDGSQRMVIEHVQSGSRTVVASPSDAVAWISDQTAGVAEGCAAQVSGRGEDRLGEQGA